MGSQDVLPLNLIALPAKGAVDTGIPLIKNGCEAATRTLNLEP